MAWHECLYGGGNALETKMILSFYYYATGRYTITFLDAETGDFFGNEVATNTAPTFFDTQNITASTLATATVTITLKKAYKVYTISGSTKTFLMDAVAGDTITFTATSKKYLFE